MSGDHQDWDNRPPKTPNEAPKPSVDSYSTDRKKEEKKQKLLWILLYFLIFVLFCILTWH